MSQRLTKQWLAKTEPDVFSIEDLAKKGSTLWDGVRNYQARNYLMAMKKGDLVLIYHSNAKPSGIIGLGRVTKEAVADPTQFDKKSEYYDAKSVKEKPRWFCPEISFVEKFEKIIPLDSLKTVKALKKMPLLQRGSRLSVQPVQDLEFKVIKELSKAL